MEGEEEGGSGLEEGGSGLEEGGSGLEEGGGNNERPKKRHVSFSEAFSTQWLIHSISLRHG